MNHLFLKKKQGFLKMLILIFVTYFFKSNLNSTGVGGQNREGGGGEECPKNYFSTFMFSQSLAQNSFHYLGISDYFLIVSQN
mgnify:CR=1 FL=1